MFVFVVKNLVFGACDEDHLKEVVENIWNEICDGNIEKDDVVVSEINEMNVVGYDSPVATYYLDAYDNCSKLGLRLFGLGGEIDIQLGIDISDEFDIYD